MKDEPHYTYQEQYRKCGKSYCHTCQEGQGHGPYWYAYWRGEDGKIHSRYIGKHKTGGEIEHMKASDQEKARQIMQAQFGTIVAEETNNGAREINVDGNQYKKTYRKISLPEFESRIETGKILYTVKPSLSPYQWKEYLKSQGISSSKANEFMNVYRRLGSNREHIRAIASRFIPWDELARSCHPKVPEELFEQFLAFFPENPTELKNKAEALSILHNLLKPQLINEHILDDDELTELLTLPEEAVPAPLISHEEMEPLLERLGNNEFMYGRLETALDEMRRGHYILKQTIEELLNKLVSAS